MCKRILTVLLCICIILSNCIIGYAENLTDTAIKNIIYLIPDGGAMKPFMLAQAVKQKGGFDESLFPNATNVDAGDMYLSDYLVGAETTDSAGLITNPIPTTTDSAAAGTALSTGCKTYNDMIGIDTSLKPRANILEASQAVGKRTGIVSTYEWTNATPASFSSHDISRANAYTLSEQIVNQKIDVVIGSEHSNFTSAPWYTDGELSKRGYEVIKSKEALMSVKQGDRIWAKLGRLYYDYNKAETTPNLAEMTQAAITALENDDNGFFLMVEGSAVDGGGHANDAVYMASEYLAFDKACEVAIEYAKGRSDTLVVVAPDHDTGGIDWSDSKIDDIVANIRRGSTPSSPDITWETKGHTSRNGGVFMYVPDGVAYPEGIDETQIGNVKTSFASTDYRTSSVNLIDNTDIPKYLADIIGVDFDMLTNRLFVNVTDRGTYNETTEVFEFNDYPVTIKKNSSTAYIKGEETDLNGEIAVCIEGNFYVPKYVLQLAEQTSVGNDDKLTVRADYNTKEVTIKGYLPESLHDNVSLIITKPGITAINGFKTENIAYIYQTQTDNWGYYNLNFDMEYLAGDYTLYMNYESNLVDTGEGIEERTFRFKNLFPTLSVTKGEEVINQIEQLSVNDELYVNLSGFDFDENFKGVVAVGQYQNKILRDVESVKVNGGSVEVDGEIHHKLTVKEDVDEIRVFYWNAETLCPVTGVYVID